MKSGTFASKQVAAAIRPVSVDTTGIPSNPRRMMLASQHGTADFCPVEAAAPG